MKNKQGQTVCYSCSTPDQPLLSFDGHQYCSDCAAHQARLRRGSPTYGMIKF